MGQDLLIPGRHNSTLRMWFVECPCGRTTGQHDGFLDTHFPPLDGRPLMVQPFGDGSTCRYSGRSITLAAALDRDSQLTKLEGWFKAYA
jgi:hypothetical protein